MQSSGATIFKEPQKPKAHIRCYLDFDGTLTNRSGKPTVLSAMYKSLLLNPKVGYIKADFKPKEAMLAILQSECKELTNADMMITQEAAEFLGKMLAQNADIVILSKNRREYVEVMLLLVGFSQDSISKILIIDIKDMQERRQGKYDTIKNCEQQKGKANVLVIADDDEEDYPTMVLAAHERGYQNATLVTATISKTLNPNDIFDWTAICTEALQKVQIELTTQTDTNSLGPKKSSSA